MVLKKDIQTIDAYIWSCSAEIALLLNQIRNCIQHEAPTAEGTISYNMPAFILDNKILVYFAAFKNHIGFYALPNVNCVFHKELLPYKTGRASIQFQLDKEIPFELIREIVQFRIREIVKI